MGLAASQARLLLLTSRKSDLEYRAQQITNSLMILAQQTETVAREYSVKISNQTIIYQSADKDQTTKTLTAENFANQTAGGYKLYELPQDEEWKAKLDNYYINSEGDKITAEDYKRLNETDPEKAKEYSKTDETYVSNNYSGPEILERYNNGTLVIKNAKGEVVDLNGNNGFVTTYYTDDDKAAEAEYNTKTASIQVKEKRLQNDLNQIQTQQSACDTEIDSVKKILDKNIERTFKVFS